MKDRNTWRVFGSDASLWSQNGLSLEISWFLLRSCVAGNWVRFAQVCPVQICCVCDCACFLLIVQF